MVKHVLSLCLLLLITACAAASDDADLAERQMTRAYVETSSGHSLSYIKGGTQGGQRIIFVHGTPGSARGWISAMAEAPQGFEVIAIDRPGFGETRPSGAVVSLMTQASVLEPLLNAANGKKPILVGHSLGGPIVAAAAVLFGDRIGGVVIAAGSLDPSLEKIHPMQYVGAAPPIRWLLPRHIKNANTELMGLKPELEALAERLNAVTTPIEIVHGTKDDLVPYENVAFMETRLTAASKLEVVTLDGVNHFLPWNSSNVLWQAILRLSAENDERNYDLDY